MLERKREAVVRFVAALQEASGRGQSSTPEELAEIAMKVEPFATVRPGAGGRELDDHPGDDPGPTGPRAHHRGRLERAPRRPGEVGGGGIDPADPNLSYEAVVDMSYYDEAAERG